MTLTELRYIAAVARFRHFGRAAEHCFVSQPTLSVGVRKLEEELGVTLFERGKNEISITPVGERIVEQARRVLEEAELLASLAQQGQDQLAGPFRLGVIYTIGPFLIPYLLTALRKEAPRLQLILKEGFTDALLGELRDGGLDAVLLALPADVPGIVTRELYAEPFMVAVAADHPWSDRASIAVDELKDETVLLLSAGNCFRDQVIEACPECLPSGARNDVQRALEGSSIATLRQMAAAGVGVTVVPATSTSLHNELDGLLVYRPFSAPPPRRRVGIAHRQTFPRPLAIDALERAVRGCDIPEVEKL